MQVWYQRFGYTVGLGTLDPEDEYRKEKRKKAIDTKWYVAFVASRPHGSTNMAAGKKEMVDVHNARIDKRKRQAVVCFKSDSCVVVIVVE